MNELDAAISATIHSIARHIAANENLIDEEGIAWCRNCGANHALLPSLHCPICLGEAYARLGIVAPRCVNERQQQRMKGTGT